MAPMLPLETWSIRAQEPDLRPVSKHYFICEGANTEYWYLSGLATRLAKEGIPELIELKPVKRTGIDANVSAPRRLLGQACEIREDVNGEFEFDPATDGITIVFDVDVYKGDERRYLEDLDDMEKVAEVAVTNPGFELFLLLHAPNAIDDIIRPNAEALLNNRHAANSKRRIADKLVSDVFAINPKSNPEISSLSSSFNRAVQAEKFLNQDARKAIGRLTSNIGKSIFEIVELGRNDSNNRFI